MILFLSSSFFLPLQTTLDEGTEPWGVMVERVEVKDVRVPEQLQRAMAAEAEAAREANAKVISIVMQCCRYLTMCLDCR